MKVTIDSWVVLNCDSRIVTMDSYKKCCALAEMLNRESINQPYTTKYVRGEVDC